MKMYNLEKISVIGQGAYGKVYKCKDLDISKG
jgi:serine/threonine protein kinase